MFNKRVFIALLLLALSTTPRSLADEGMWLVNLINGELYSKMKLAGVELTSEQIYSQRQLSLKDAIVAINHGECSGTIISADGLMITNHHCAYSDVHANSTIENNYLENGFWAESRTDEITIEGKSVTLLKGVEDVTELVAHLADSLDRIGPRGVRFLGKLEKAIASRIETDYQIELHSMWRGQRYYLYYYQTFNDVRLVGAPPLSVGAFGGEQDNWSWPQHKGDFALYRIYASPDGSPAKYSTSNIPIKSNHFLEISSRGYQDGDYTMILGYPGSTNRYSSAAEVREKFEITNPVISSVRRQKLDVWKKHMELSAEVRLKYADKYFGVSNYCDFAKWENLSIEKYDIIGERELREQQLSEWIASDEDLQAEYGSLLADLDSYYRATAQLVVAKEYIRETMIRGSDIALLAQRFKSLRNHFNQAHKIDCKRHAAIQKFCRINIENIFEQGDAATDRELFEVMAATLLENVEMKYLAPELVSLFEQFEFDAAKFTSYVYQSSSLASRERFERFLSGEISKDDIERDPMFILATGINIQRLNEMEDAICDSLGYSLTQLKTRYNKALYLMRNQDNAATYPDANSTMRLTYGNVGGLSPRDGVRYHWQTTAEGVLAKHNGEDYEFAILPSFKSTLEERGWGRWAQDGELYVNFITSNDITGGNSGSSVLNSRGEVIGLAFDGNRESMGGDLQFNSDLGKCVCVDIRYVLWFIENYSAAPYLLDELIIN